MTAFFHRERAACFVIGAGLLECNSRADQLCQIYPVEQVFNKALGDQSAHSGSTSGRLHARANSQKCRRSQAPAAFYGRSVQPVAVQAISALQSSGVCGNSVQALELALFPLKLLEMALNGSGCFALANGSRLLIMLTTTYF